MSGGKFYMLSASGILFKNQVLRLLMTNPISQHLNSDINAYSLTPCIITIKIAITNT